MKTVLLTAILALSGCYSSKTIRGKEVECVGINEKKDPRYRYEASEWNLTMAAGMAAIILPTWYIYKHYYYCPEAVKRKRRKRK